MTYKCCEHCAQDVRAGRHADQVNKHIERCPKSCNDQQPAPAPQAAEVTS